MIRFLPHRRTALSAAGLALAATCLAAPALAEGTLTASLSESGVWDSNPLMLRTGAKDLYGSTTAPALMLKQTTPTFTLQTQARAQINVYNLSAYNSNDAFGSLSAVKKAQLWELGINAGIDRDTTRTSEVTTFGRDIGNVRHTAFRAAPQIAFNATQLDRLEANASYLKSVYEGGGQVDYEVFGTKPSWSHNFTQLHTGYITFQAQRYQTRTQAHRRVDSLGPSLGWKALLTPQATLQISGGAQTAKETADGQPEQKWKWNYVFSSSLTFKRDQDTLALSGTRQRQPYSNGSESLLTTFSLDEAHKLNENLSLSARASYQFSDNSSASASGLKNLITGQAGASYALNRSFDLSASYQYRRETFRDAGGKAQENVGRLGLTYRPNLESFVW